MRSFLGVPIVAPPGVIGALLPDREARRDRLHRRGRGADRAARGPRRDRDHERAAVRGEPGAVDRRRAEPARARAARRGQPEAVRPRPERGGRRDAARPRPGRGARPGRAAAELAREALDELRVAHLRAAPARPRARRARRCAAQARRAAAPAPAARDRARPRRRARRRPARDREVLRIAQEALQNALKHAQAEHVAVRLRAATAGSLLEVADDGAGFDPDTPGSRSRRLGLTSMEERARARSAARSRSSRRRAPARRSGWRSAMAEAIRVLVVDDHAVVREGLRAFLELQDGIEVVGEAADGERGGRRRRTRLRPDVVLMDLVMPRLDGVGAMRRAPRARPGARVIVLTSFLDDDEAAARAPGGRGRLPAQERAAAGARARRAGSARG